IILLGEMWWDLARWIKKWPLKNKLLDNDDFELLFLAKNCNEAFIIIKSAYEGFIQSDSKFCLNFKKYKI
ncbi:MAG: hypothetical protein NWF08_05960, partial [Candidatus Bathyarchaeota archaeon]|nr:hypothetical protein [Candidatus Bathyarchaeota archaeon]